jgi:hypothetical protein
MSKKPLILTLCLTLLLSVALISPVTAEAANMNKILGRHYYLLNILGKKDGFGSHQTFDNPDRHTIFVPEDTTGYHADVTMGNLSLTDSIILRMTSGPEFAVIDGNGMDGEAALQLESGKYYVFITALAKPSKDGDPRSADVTGWYHDDEGDLCYLLGSVSISRSKGKPVSEDATDLFYIAWRQIASITGLDDAVIEGYLDAYGDYAIGDDVWIFDFLAMLQDVNNDTDYYFWQLHNSGLKHIQVRFYRQ